MKRRVLSLLLIASLFSFCLGGCSNSDDNTDDAGEVTPESSVTEEDITDSNEYSLDFPEDSYTEETKTVSTTDGDKEVTYRYYTHLCYVQNPVDVDYQSMNIKVPVQIDGEDIDATDAPILFKNSVGGYLSATNSDDESQQNSFTEDIIADETSDDATDETASDESDTDESSATDSTEKHTSDSETDTDGDGLVKHASADEIGNTDLALAAGYVIIEPGCRGRDNQAEDGTYYGKAPAAVVDLKAAIRYLRYNDDIIPGDTEHIISTGVSAGGAISAVLGASGNSELYDAYLDALGAADERDDIYGAACYCPITDLEHADMAYEWMFGTTQLDGSLVDQDAAGELAELFVEYQDSLKLTGLNDFGTITADNLKDYILNTYLVPSANTYLSNLSESERTAYLDDNPWITWKNDTADFSWSDYVEHIGRMKGAPAFDDFGLTSGETILFGDEDTNAKHFTNFSIDHNTADEANTEIDGDLQTIINMMNPMYFILQDYDGCCDNWWIRYGTSDTNTALPVITNLATSLENDGKDVNTLMYWDAGHGADEDPEDFVQWIADISDYNK